MKIFVTMLAAILIAGCATTPTTQQLAGADYGEEPVQYQEIIKAFMARQLKDPESARYEFSATPVKAWYGAAAKEFGWAACAHINAKNSFGGYTGPRKSYFFFKSGLVVESAHSGEPGGAAESLVYELCSKL